MGTGFLFRVMNIDHGSKTDCSGSCTTLQIHLKMELYTSNGWIIVHVNCLNMVVVFFKNYLKLYHSLGENPPMASTALKIRPELLPVTYKR